MKSFFIKLASVLTDFFAFTFHLLKAGFSFVFTNFLFFASAVVTLLSLVITSITAAWNYINQVFTNLQNLDVSGIHSQSFTAGSAAFDWLSVGNFFFPIDYLFTVLFLLGAVWAVLISVKIMFKLLVLITGLIP